MYVSNHDTYITFKALSEAMKGGFIISLSMHACTLPYSISEFIF